jgi:hypothetical protein
MKLIKTGLALLMTTALTLPAAALDIGGRDRGVGVSVDRDGVHARAGKTSADVSLGGGSGNDSAVDVDAKVGDSITAKAKVGGGSAVDADVKIGNATAKATILGPNGAANASLTSDALDGINARLEVLSTETLATICADVGGGAGCSSGDRSELLGLIQGELTALTGEQLASLCLSVGGSGCGGGAGEPEGPGSPPGGTGAPGGGVDVPIGPGGPGAGGPGAGGPGAGGLRNGLSEGERARLVNRCSDIMLKPYKYDAELIQLCRMLAQM